jgi:hypothetical protein
LLASYLFEATSTRRLRRSFALGFGLVALLAVLGYFNFGFFHFNRSEPLIHAHEQFHFYVGSEYLEEVRYDGIYLATALAAEEDLEHYGEWRLRDPMTKWIRHARYLRDEASEVKARFSEERWDSFKDDRRFYTDELELDAKEFSLDHGNTGSPVWAMLASFFTRTLGTSRTAANVYVLIDQVLLLGLFIAMWRGFGPRAACIAIAVGLLPPRVYDYLGGSLLRLDWLFAVGLSACYLKAGRHKTAGIFLGYAVARKIFCGLVALALGLRFLIDAVRARRLRRAHVEFVVAAVVASGAGVVFSALFFGGFDIWSDFWERILATYHMPYYTSNHSLRDLFLQASHSGVSVLDWYPEQIAAALKHVDIRNYLFSFWAIQVVILTAFLFVLARHETVFAFGVGVLFIFVVFVTNMYYWQMLLLIALGCAGRYREDPRKLLYLVFLCVFLMAEYVFVHFNTPRWHGYFGSYWLGLLCVFVFLVEIASTERVRGFLRQGRFRLFRK